MKFAVLGAGGVSGNPAFCPQRCFRLSVGHSLLLLTKPGLAAWPKSAHQGCLIFVSRPQVDK